VTQLCPALLAQGHNPESCPHCVERYEKLRRFEEAATPVATHADSLLHAVVSGDPDTVKRCLRFLIEKSPRLLADIEREFPS
jgi:hypothetical protein